MGASMPDFPKMAVPAERHPTPAARQSLSSILAFDDDASIQDWERFHADEHRIAEFLNVYVSRKIDDDQRYLLMDLILASPAFADAGSISKSQWTEIDTLLLANSTLHLRTIWE